MTTHALDSSLDERISKRLISAEAVRSSTHESSGKLSASRLMWPLQWQMLKVLGVEGQEVGPYTLRKFVRGRQVEDWLRSHMDCIDKERYVEYRDVVGFIDAIVDMTDWGSPAQGLVPHEIKSVTNMKFKWIIKKKNIADEHHIMQAALYALAMDSEYFALDYVASDDLRLKTFLFETKDYKSDVDKLIDQFLDVKGKGIVPTFQPRLKWQENVEYNQYPEWAPLTQTEIVAKLKAEYPRAFEKLNSSA